MGIFNFLKKSKDDAPKPGMDLPPVPEMAGVGGFPELPQEEVPKLPEEALPPLPQMSAEETVPELPKMPETPLPEPPGMPPGMEDMPQLPSTPSPAAPMHAPSPMPTAEMPEQPMPPQPEFPAIPDQQGGDLIPNKIPPLEGVPEPPKLGEAPIQRKKEDDFPPAPGERPPVDLEAVYEEAPEEKYTELREKQIRKVLRGPLFLKADSVKGILENTEEVRATFRNEDDIFFRINEVKNTQDKQYEKFRQTLEDMQRKLIFIDRSLFEKRY